jgi:hypothetical protein
MALAPWCANEKWVFGIDAVTGKHYALVSGRARCPPALKRNIAWWFRNDFEQQLPDWYEPNLPLQQRLNDWAIRNPLQNANLFVWGIADRNYRVEVLEGVDDPMVVQRNDVIDPATGKPGGGYQRCKLTLDDGSVRYWTNFCRAATPTKKGLVYSYGCQPSGIFELKYNRPAYTG